VGQAVRVPFGDKLLQGIVMQLTDCPEVTETRDIAAIIEEQPLLSTEKIMLAYWLSEHYLPPSSTPSPSSCRRIPA